MLILKRDCNGCNPTLLWETKQNSTNPGLQAGRHAAPPNTRTLQTESPMARLVETLCV